MIDAAKTTEGASVSASPPSLPVADPTVALMNDIARLSIDYAETRWQRALLSGELRARAMMRIAWLSLLALPPGLIAASLAAHAIVQLCVAWGMVPWAAYAVVALFMGSLCVGAILLAKRTAVRWLR